MSHNTISTGGGKRKKRKFANFVKLHDRPYGLLERKELMLTWIAFSHRFKPLSEVNSCDSPFQFNISAE